MVESDLEGTKMLQNAYSDLVSDVSGVSKDKGARLHQWSILKAKNQQFEISKIKDKEYYRIKACHSGLFLSIGSASVEENGEVLQWPWHGGYDQNWKIEQNSSGYYTITNVNSGLLLSIKEDSDKRGVRIVQQKDSGSYRHKWKIVLPADL